MQNITKTTCPYCGVGCGVTVQTNGDKISVSGDKTHPANFGLLCSKGSALADSLIPDGRLSHPEIKGHRESWEKSVSYVASRFNQVIAEFGQDAVAFYVSGQLLTEDYYVANKLMKGYIGSGNIDTNSRLCMSSTVAGFKRAFGTDTVAGCYEDLEQANLVFLIGSNLAWCHPILFQRLKKAKQNNPELKVVVVDPRKTASCDIADRHLPLTPGSDVAYFNGLLSYLEQANVLDREFIQQHSEGFGEALEVAKAETGSWEELARECGLSRQALLQSYLWFANEEKTVSVFSQGVNQSTQGTDKVNAIINCHLATGRIGKPGATPFSVTGQPNAMGGREVGGLANTLASHLEFGKSNQTLLQDFWQSPAMAQGPGYKATEVFDRVLEGKVKAIWIMGTNPAVSLPDSHKIRKALLHCPFVVVSDCIKDTDTNRFADVLLPAKGWGEKSGTVTNSERRISRQRGFLAGVGEARSDWQIICAVAKRMGFAAGFGYQDEAGIFAEYVASTRVGPQRDLDLSGLKTDKGSYEAMSPVQWPVNSGKKTQRPFADGGFYTASGRAKFIPVRYKEPVSKSTEKYPFILNTGRYRDQWHTMTRTGLSAGLSSYQAEPVLAVSPVDAKCLGLVAGHLVQVSSNLSASLVRVAVCEDQKAGEVFFPIHWSGQNSSSGLVSALIAGQCDPISGQPDSKFTPVNITPWECVTEARVFSRKPLQCDSFEYWTRQKLDQGFVYRIASSKTTDELLELFALPQLGKSYRVIEKQQLRVGIEIEGQLQFGASLHTPGEKPELEWLEQVTGLPADQLGETVLKGKAGLSLGPLVCSCNQVREQEIIQAIERGADSVELIGSKCKAGTNCGSCVGELKGLLKRINIKVA